MSKNKATHSGTCQWCGREQKLPNGLLSTHGYAVMWSSFVGTCRGAGYLPFEQSKDLIEKAIGWAQEDNVRLEAERQMRMHSTSTQDVMCYVFVGTKGMTRRGETRRWMTGEIVLAEKSRHGMNFELIEKHTGNRYYVHSTNNYSKDPLTAVAYANQHRASFLAKMIEQNNHYIEWQQSRIENWQPRELKPVKE